MFRAFNRGVEIPAPLIAELRDSSDCRSLPDSLQDRLSEDGYVLLRSVVPPDHVLAAREEILMRLASVDEIACPAIEGIVTGRSRRLELAPDPGLFWKSVSEGEALRRVTHGPAVRHLMAALFGEPVVGHDLIYLRAAAPGRALDVHYDYPFFTNKTERVLSVWLALGDVPVTDGPLLIIEGSNQYEDLIGEMSAIDQAAPLTRKLAYDQSAISLAIERKTRILTTDFGAGDVIVFSMLTAHGSLDNRSTIGRARLSCDLRYQPDADPRDSRFFGPDPVGLTGDGYAGLNGAKPLTASWQTR
jgi:hypothetical protein